MSPLQIEILMHYYYSAHDWNEGDFSKIRVTISSFRDDLNLLEEAPKGSDRSYKLTQRGEAYVNFLMDMPLPIAVTTWELPEKETPQ